MNVGEILKILLLIVDTDSIYPKFLFHVLNPKISYISIIYIAREALYEFLSSYIYEKVKYEGLILLPVYFLRFRT